MVLSLEKIMLWNVTTQIASQKSNRRNLIIISSFYNVKKGKTGRFYQMLYILFQILMLFLSTVEWARILLPYLQIIYVQYLKAKRSNLSIFLTLDTFLDNLILTQYDELCSLCSCFLCVRFVLV